MNKDTIVFINKHPLSKVFAEALNFERFSDAGFKLIYLDMKYFYFKETHSSYGSGSNGYVVEKDWFIKCESKDDVRKYVKQYSSNAWFFVLHESLLQALDDAWLFRWFKKNNCNYLLMEILNVPNGLPNETGAIAKKSLERLLRVVALLDLTRILKRIKKWMFLFLKGRDIIFKSPAICFAAGEVALNLARKLYPNSDIAAIPNLNYQKYLQVTKKKPNQSIDSDKFILYLDQAYFDSPDDKIFGTSVNKASFLKKITIFFDNIEGITGYKVKVAASPKYDYRGGEYGDREIIKDKTVELVASSEMVITHNTSAVEHAVLMHKPIIFLNVDCNENVVYSMQCYAASLGKEILSFDDDLDANKLQDYLSVDDQAYNNYINNYIQTQTFEKSSTEIIIEKLKEISFE